MQEIKIWSRWQMVYLQTKFCPRKWDIKFSGTLTNKQVTQSPARGPDVVLIKKKSRSSRFCHSHGPGSKNKKKKKDRLYLAQELKKAVEHDSDTNCSWGTWNNLQRPEKETGETKDNRKNQDHLKSAEICRRVLETRGDISEKPRVRNCIKTQME